MVYSRYALTSYLIKTREEQAGHAVLAFVFISFSFYDIAWTPFPITYTVEIFPYTTCSKGLTTALVSSYTD